MLRLVSLGMEKQTSSNTNEFEITGSSRLKIFKVHSSNLRVSLDRHTMPKRRKLNTEGESLRILPKRSHICPICSSSIPVADLPAHYAHERSLLSTPQPTNKRPAAVLALAKIVDRPRLAKRSEVNSLLNRVRSNRDARRNNEQTTEEEGQIEECPVCGLCLAGTGTSVTEHVTSCIDSRLHDEDAQQENGWDMYEVGGQTRVRAIDLLEGGIQSLPGATIHTDNDDGVEVYVDVEGDSEAVYGKTQYTEADLINPTSKPDGKPPGSKSC